jgi:hypothetical protein
MAYGFQSAISRHLFLPCTKDYATRSVAVLFPSVPSRKAKIGTSIVAFALQLLVATLAAPVALPGFPENQRYLRW